MEPVIPLQPYIREGEGHGSAYITPRQERYTALDILLKEGNEKKQEQKIAQKQLQNDLIEIETATGNLLPEHQMELLKLKGELMDAGAKMQMKGSNPWVQGSDAYFDMQKRIAELKALAKNGQIAKEHIVKQMNLKSANPDKYDDTSLSDIKKAITSTSLRDLDYNNFGSIETALDPFDYRNKAVAKIDPKVTWDMKSAQPIPGGGGAHALVGTKRADIDAATNAIMDDTSKNGVKYKDLYYNKFLNLPPEERDIIIKTLAAKNASVKDKPEVLKKEATRYMVNNSLDGFLKDEVINKIIPNYEYQSMLRQREQERGGSPDRLWTKTPVTIGGAGGRESFNKRYNQNYTADQWKAMGGMEDKEREEYIAIGARKGNPDNESILLSIDGKPFKPQGYQVDQDGNIMATGAVVEFADSGKRNRDGEVIQTEKYVPKKRIKLSQTDIADLAAHYHFKSVDAFKEWLTSKSENGSSSQNSNGTTRSRQPNSKINTTKKRKFISGF